jgi:diguanylate cyclase (GGDEF)-like protein
MAYSVRNGPQGPNPTAQDAGSVEIPRAPDAFPWALVRQLTQGSSLDTVLEALAAHIEKRLGADHACAFLVVQENFLRLSGAPQLPGSLRNALDGIDISPDGPLCAIAAYQGEPILVPDFSASSRWEKEGRATTALGWRACWAIPIFSSGFEVLGTAVVYCREPWYANQEITEWMNNLLLLAALAIERERADDNVAAHDSRAQRHSEALAALARDEALSEGDLSRAMGRFTENAGRGADSDRVSVWSLGETAEFLECQDALLVPQTKHSVEERLRLEDFRPFAQALRSQDAVHHFNLNAEPALMAAWRSHAPGLPTQLLLLTPLRGRGKLIGALIFERSSAKRAWSLEDGNFAVAVAALIALGFEADQRNLAESRAHYLAHYDSLTDLPNRVLSLDRLTMAIAAARRKNARVGIALLDVDRFKAVNDSLGHEAGDQVLRITADRIKGAVRESDSVARLGGDEFLIVASLGKNESIDPLARRIVAACAQPLEAKGMSIQASVSVGLSHFPDDGKDPLALIKNAEIAMYQAKKLGRSRFQTFSAPLQQEAVQTLTAANSFRRALLRDEFVLHYQPLIHLQTGQVTAAEALIRWRQPDGKLTLPAMFLEAAEQHGLMSQLTEWVLRAACRDIRLRRDAKLPIVTVLVNTSSSDLTDGHLVQLVDRAASDAKIDPKDLQIEVSEGVIRQHLAVAVQVLSELRQLGTGICIDNFAGGYASLNSISRLPIARLKIDQTLIRHLGEDAGNERIARALLALTKELRLPTTAEGVESRRQFRLLRKFGCNEGQGFLFGRPMPAPDFVTFLRKRRPRRT